MKRVFLSFHYTNDNWRVQQIKNIGSIEEQPILNYNEWETIKSRGDQAIKNWINEQMKHKSCVVVLVGSETANRKWINYEISHAWDNYKPIVGLRIHKLVDSSQNQSTPGDNPFKYVKLTNGNSLDQIVPIIEPQGQTGKEVYDWVKSNIETVVEKAVKRT